MGFWRSAGKVMSVTAKVAGRVGAAALKLSGHALSRAAEWTADHENDIAGAGRVATSLTGQAVKGTARALQSAASVTARALHDKADSTTNNVAKVAARAGGHLADGLVMTGKLAAKAGEAVQSASDLVGGTTGGVVVGTVRTISTTVDAFALTADDFARLQQRLGAASEAIREQADRDLARIARAQKRGSKQDLLDLLTVGGITLAASLRDPGSLPEDVQRAFQLTYPEIARRGETFTTFVDGRDPEQLVGVVNAIKGKLFEIKLVDYLNDGNLPEGARAELATAATQPGYDIRIVGAEGQLIDLLQAKATESASYVQQAIDRYPDIDVTTTSEVYGRLAALGQIDGVRNSGISEDVLQAKVESAVSEFSAGPSDLVPSVAALAVIALSSFMGGGQSLEQQGARIGSRAAKVGITGAAGKAVLVATQTWWLGLLVGMGSHWLSAYGGNRREEYEALLRAVEAAEGLAARKPIMLQHQPTRLGLST
jgi:hypothetical protein